MQQEAGRWKEVGSGGREEGRQTGGKEKRMVAKLSSVTLFYLVSQVLLPTDKIHPLGERPKYSTLNILSPCI